MGSGSGSGGGGAVCPGLIWSFLWLVALLLIGWPVAFLLAWVYVLLMPFAVCIGALKDLNETLLRLMQLPNTFTDNMVNMKPCCS